MLWKKIDSYVAFFDKHVFGLRKEVLQIKFKIKEPHIFPHPSQFAGGFSGWSVPTLHCNAKDVFLAQNFVKEKESKQCFYSMSQILASDI